MPSETTAVVLADPEPPDAEMSARMAGAVAPVLGLVRYDAMRLVKQSSGILVENVSADTAVETVDALGGIGVAAAVADTAGMDALPDPRLIHCVAVDGDGLLAGEYEDRLERFPWPRVTVLSICRCVRDDTGPTRHRKLPKRRGGGMFAAFMVGGPVGAAFAAGREMHKRYKDLRESNRRIAHSMRADETFAADVLLSDPLERLRIFASGCSYGYLAERMEKSAVENFRIWVADMAESSSGMCLLSPMATRFLDGDDLSDRLIDNLHDFDRYNRWLLLAATAFAGSDDADDTPRDSASDFIGDDF